MSLRRFVNLFLIVLLMLPEGGAWFHPDIQQDVADPEVEALLAQMGPEERVGQLFLVTFYGTDVSETSDIATLITRYHVGGVVLLAENDNFNDSDGLLAQVYQLTSALQTLASKQQQAPLTQVPEASSRPGPYVPLFIGLEHEGSGPTHTQLLSGVTPLPSSMALGATWDPAFAEQTGQVVGEELSALGINLLLGPSADVVEFPQPFTAGDLGTWVFGGEPFWVSQMTAAYVHGVHEGSSGRIAVIPRHFPGQGGADRLESVEVPTVRRSLEQLTKIDLIPFFAVTGATSDPLAVADGLMTGHVSYLGFQGDNPRAATRPISLDRRALQELMKLEPLATWRSNGGLIISDALGLRGIRRLYDPQEASFPNRRIAQDALMAGNDVLYLGNFGKNAPLDQTTVIHTIDFFVQAYHDDPAFQARVDDAVRRILHTKLDLYGSFNLEGTILPPAGTLETVGQHTDVTFGTAQGALTLLSPPTADLLASPQADERIVIFTDTRSVRQCTTCTPRPLIAVDALQSAIMRLQASELVGFRSIQSFTFDQLVNYLQFGPQVITSEGSTPTPDSLSLALNSADWVVFVMLDVNTAAIPSSDVVKRFLAVPPVSPDTQIVVMAMGAPYYLDSTEISKLTAYYGLYGYTEPFVDVAARVLFLDAPFDGASPVSVTGITYNIVEETSPDPNQVIKLFTNQAGTDTDETPPPTPVLGKGDTLQLSTGIIVDRNGHPVPDGTPVEFVLNYVSEGLNDSLLATTVGGIAHAEVLLNRAGELTVTASSNLAVQSDTVTINLPDTGGASISVLPPDIPPTPTLVPTEFPATAVPTPIPTPPPDTDDGTGWMPHIVGFGDLILALFGLTMIGLTVFVFGLNHRDLNYGLLLSLPTIVVGLASYNYYALYMPGAMWWRSLMGDTWGASIAAWLGSLFGFAGINLALYAWERWLQGPLMRRSHH